MNDEQRKVRKFYKEFLSWKAENIGVWIGAGFIEVLFAVMMMIPYQEMLHDPGLFVFPVLFGWLGPMLYLKPYQTFAEGQQQCSIYEKIKYLPIDLKEIRKMRVVYLASFVGKIFPIMMILQLLCAYWSFKEITIANIIYAIGMGFVLPVLGNLPGAVIGK